MNRRGFIGTLAAAAVAPFMPSAQPSPCRLHTTGNMAFLTSISINGKVVATFDPPRPLIYGETLRILQDNPAPPFRWHSYEVAMCDS